MYRLKLTTALTAVTLLGVSAASAATIFDTFDDDIDEVRRVSYDGGTFTDRLASDYRDFTLFEADVMFDWVDADHFAQKAMRAAGGEVVLPEDPNDWNIDNDERMAELEEARTKLVSLLDDGAREAAPSAAALAQAKYDCWVEQQEEGWQLNHIAACRNDFLTAAALLRAELEPNFPELAERLFFEFDRSDLTAEARKKLDDLADEIKEAAPAEVTIVGHADRAGTADYNVKLSRLRAKSVANALVSRGVTGVRVDYELIARGESAPLILTGDDVRNPANRRVAVYTEEPDVFVTLVGLKGADPAMPQSISIPFPEDIRDGEMKRRLESLGFADVQNVRGEGQVFRADAMWAGDPVSLRIDAETGIIRDITNDRIVGMPEFVHFPLPDNTTAGDVERRLAAIGFSDVRDVSGEGDVYDAKAVWQNESVDLRVDVESGIITDVSETDEAADIPTSVNFNFPDSVTAGDVRAKLEEAGFRNVYDVEGEGQVYDARALWNGRSLPLRIDVETGTITPKS